MKNLIIAVLAITLFSCTKEMKPNDQERNKNNQAELASLSITISNPAPNTIEWSLPLIPTGKKLIYTYVFWFKNGVRQGATQVNQFNINTTQYINDLHSTNLIPAGTYEVSVAHYVADATQWTYIAETIYNAGYSARINVTFN